MDTNQVDRGEGRMAQSAFNHHFIRNPVSWQMARDTFEALAEVQPCGLLSHVSPQWRRVWRSFSKNWRRVLARGRRCLRNVEEVSYETKTFQSVTRSCFRGDLLVLVTRRQGGFTTVWIVKLHRGAIEKDLLCDTELMSKRL